MADDSDFDGSDFEPSSAEKGVSTEDESRHVAASRHQDARFEAAGAQRPSSKWERLQRYYNDNYLDLLRETFDDGKLADRSNSQFQTSQLGASTWTPTEKARLFEGLETLGRHELPALSRRIQTKSQPEVASFLQKLQLEEMNRQLFERHTRNMSLTDLPAAIEVGPETEIKLERAADSLAAFQEQYDYAMGQQDSTMPFIINYDVAFRLNRKTNEGMKISDADESSSEAAGPGDYNLHELFNLTTFLELSQKFFMHGSQKDPKNNWGSFAEPNESPAITQDAVVEYHGLVVGLLRRIIQTTLFLAQSRIRASTVSDHLPEKAVHRKDVHSALVILNLKRDLWQYWVGLPRRFPFRVVKGTNRKGESDKAALGYDEVEASLSVRHSSGRRRSVSVLSGTSSATRRDSDQTSQGSRDVEASSSADDEKEVAATMASSESEDINMEDSDGSSSTDRSGAPSQSRQLRMPLNKRKRQLEEELDEHLEALDQKSKQDEEARINALLGFEASETAKQPIEIGRRPKVLRKSVEDVMSWTSTYAAAWESHPATKSVGDSPLESNESFLEDEVD